MPKLPPELADDEEEMLADEEVKMALEKVGAVVADPG